MIRRLLSGFKRSAIGNPQQFSKRVLTVLIMVSAAVAAAGMWYILTSGITIQRGSYGALAPALRIMQSWWTYLIVMGVAARGVVLFRRDRYARQASQYAGFAVSTVKQLRAEALTSEGSTRVVATTEDEKEEIAGWIREGLEGVDQTPEWGQAALEREAEELQEQVEPAIGNGQALAQALESGGYRAGEYVRPSSVPHAAEHNRLMAIEQREEQLEPLLDELMEEGQTRGALTEAEAALADELIQRLEELNAERGEAIADLEEKERELERQIEEQELEQVQPEPSGSSGGLRGALRDLAAPLVVGSALGGLATRLILKWRLPPNSQLSTLLEVETWQGLTAGRVMEVAQQHELLLAAFALSLIPGVLLLLANVARLWWQQRGDDEPPTVQRESETDSRSTGLIGGLRGSSIGGAEPPEEPDGPEPPEEERMPFAAEWYLARKDLAATLDGSDIIWQAVVPAVAVFGGLLMAAQLWVAWFVYPIFAAAGALVGCINYWRVQRKRHKQLHALRKERTHEQWDDAAVLVKKVDAPELTMCYGWLQGTRYAHPDPEHFAQEMAVRVYEVLHGEPRSPSVMTKYHRQLTQFFPDLRGWHELEEHAIQQEMVEQVESAPQGLIPLPMLIEETVLSGVEYKLFGLVRTGHGYDPELVRSVYESITPSTLVEHELEVEGPDGGQRTVTAVRKRTEPLPDDLQAMEAQFSSRFRNYAKYEPVWQLPEADLQQDGWVFEVPEPSEEQVSAAARGGVQ